jgi:hypothetical protein
VQNEGIKWPPVQSQAADLPLACGQVPTRVLLPKFIFKVIADPLAIPFGWAYTVATVISG